MFFSGPGGPLGEGIVEFHSESVGPANISLPAFPGEVFLSTDFTPNYQSLTLTLSASNEEIWGGCWVVNGRVASEGRVAKTTAFSATLH